MRAVLFPGQGSQFVGMGKDFYEKFDSVKKVFKTVDNTLGFSLSNIILNGPEAELKLTQNTQPAIMTVGVSIFNVLKHQFGLNLNNAKFFAGHSLGEYSALACSGSLSFDQTIKLLQSRGRFMQSAVPKGQGGMLARRRPDRSPSATRRLRRRRCFGRGDPEWAGPVGRRPLAREAT